MRSWVLERLDDSRTVAAACAVTLVLGLVFTFVWAPHPWDWRGIDQYHNLALALARGEPFGTTDVPWGYAYYVAAFYAMFGERPWLPVTVQVFVNACAPYLLYRLALRLTTRRIAVASALLTGLFSFNTIYASTQSSDALCTVTFIAMMLWFVRGSQAGSMFPFAVAGLLAGIVPQFRPNMILFPAVLAAAYLALRPWSVRKARHAAVFLVMFAAVLAPWVVRNYGLTGMFMPTSTHGGVQLWYGTLQIGPYLESRAYNPRSVFESPAFDYTSITNRPTVVTIERRDSAPPGTSLELVYRTDRDATEHTLAPAGIDGRTFTFHVPPQPAPTAVYYYVRARWPAARDIDAGTQIIPAEAASDPYLFFVDDRHLADMDRHGDLLDVFDIARTVRHLAWGTALPQARTLDFDRDGQVTEPDVAVAVAALLGGPTLRRADAFQRITHDADAATLHLADGSTLRVPRVDTNRVTDFEPAGNLAAALTYSRRSFPWVRAQLDTPPGTRPAPCCVAGDVAVNQVFYRKEPHTMGRYLALAFDNITREPLAFAAASAYRVLRLFIVKGSDDHWTAYQFRLSSLIYLLGTALSIANLAAFLAGLWLAWRRRYAVLPLALAVAYVPATICFVLTNMRYTITVQPFMFVFVAIALLAWVEGGTRKAPPPATA